MRRPQNRPSLARDDTQRDRDSGHSTCHELYASIERIYRPDRSAMLEALKTVLGLRRSNPR